MPKLTLIGLYFWICLAQKVVSGEDVKVGGELVLKPDKSTVPGNITSIIWKHGKDKLAEWDKDFGGLDIYGAFKNRTNLDNTTGELRITSLKKTDSGVYSVEFNSKLLNKTYKLSVIKAVPKPTITSSCKPDKTSCTLTCEGDTTDAEPVTYSWKVGGRAWEVGGKQLIVFKSDTGKSTNNYKYVCKLKNSAGEEEVSEPVGEVFGPEPSEVNVGGIVVGVVVVLVAFIIGFLVWKKKTGYPDDTWINFLRKYCGEMFVKGSAGVQPEQVKGNADEDYVKVGGELVLTPDKSTVPDSITSIVWKHGVYYVADWDKDLRGLGICGAFKGRATLDQTTGELRISGLKKTDSGVYSVEFNRKLLDKTYKIFVVRGDDKTKTDGRAGPGGNDKTKTDVNAAAGGNDKTKTDVSAAPGGNDKTKTDVSAAPGGNDKTKTDGRAGPGGNDKTKTDGRAGPGGDDKTKTDGGAAAVGKDETKTDGSAAPGGDLNAAEKGEANGEGSVLLNEDRVKYHNDNREGTAEENSVL